MSDARATPGPQAPAEAEDQYARDCSTDPERSILLQAPAGSGKTTVLTERYLRLLAQVDEPEEILAITFTRKAAAEMRARVLRALDSGGAGEAADARPRSGLAARARAHAAARDWQLDQNPGRLRIQTIDALNHWIASQLPVTGRAGGSSASATAHRSSTGSRLDGHLPMPRPSPRCSRGSICCSSGSTTTTVASNACSRTCWGSEPTGCRGSCGIPPWRCRSASRPASGASLRGASTSLPDGYRGP